MHAASDKSKRTVILADNASNMSIPLETVPHLSIYSVALAEVTSHWLS